MAANDKEMHPFFEKMCHFATVHLFEFMSEFGTWENKYADSMMQLRNAHDDVREDMFLDDTFGSQSSLGYDEYIEVVSTKAAWAFTSKTLRAKVFEAAGVTLD